MPRRFSSGSRSGSVPVSLRTSAVLPWSICPAVPMIIAVAAEKTFVGAFQRHSACAGRLPPGAWLAETLPRAAVIYRGSSLADRTEMRSFVSLTLQICQLTLRSRTICCLIR